jgi:hypothetical protein
MAQWIIGLIGYCFQQSITALPEAHSEGTCWAGSSLWMADQPESLTMSEQFNLRLSMLTVKDVPCTINESNNLNISNFSKKN